jgi:N-methylhydantoinase A
MEKAIRVVSIERGFDPREFALVAFGGAGGMHACELARALSIPRVIVPQLPGALSAFGILVSDVVKDYSVTVLWRVGRGEGLPAKPLRERFDELRHNAECDFRREHWQGSIAYAPSVDVRYRGQGYELNVPFSPRLLDDFHAEHKRRYGYSHPQRDVEIVTLRLRGRVRSPEAGRAKRHAAALTESAAPRRTSVIFDRKAVPALLYERDALAPRKAYRGPAVVTEYSATTVVPPGMHFHVDQAGNLVINIR